jgi:Glutathione peroxidase
LNGKEINMSAYKGGLVIVVNTASKCGFVPQLASLEDIYKKFKNQRFMILGFPCNQFTNQKPVDKKSIVEGCVLNHGATLQIFSKKDDKEDDDIQLYIYLTSKLEGFLSKRTKWYFTKNSIDLNGEPIKRFDPKVTLENNESYIIK